MLTNSVPSPPISPGHSSVPSSQSSPRPSRLRALSYLRGYTQHHRSPSNNRSSRRTLSRSISYPSGETSPTSAPASPGIHTGQGEPYREAVVSGRLTASISPVRPHAVRTSGNRNPPIAESQPTERTSPATAPSTPFVTDGSAAASSTMARRTLHSNRTARAEPSNSPEAMRFARLDGSPNLDGPAQDPATQPIAAADSSMPPITREPSHQKMPSITFLQHQDPRSTRPSLTFAPVTRTLKHENSVIRVGRYSERETQTHRAWDAAPVGFKSKVVSRKHCEFWFSNGKWWIKDVKSSSGTFLNHIRLSPANQESRPYQVNDGDVVQLGIDFRGGEEQIFRCVKIKVESNRTWQKKLNSFNVNTHRRLRALGKSDSKEEDGPSSQSTECVICLMSIAPCQSLFVAPCSHVWHYKCIRPMLESKSYPTFVCPNCRAVTDLEADVDVPEDNTGLWDDDPEGASETHEADQNGDTDMVNDDQEDNAGHFPMGSGALSIHSRETESVSDDPPASPTAGERPESSSTRGNDGSSLLSRRQASNGSIAREGAGSITAIDMPPPVTPAQNTSTSSETADHDGQGEQGRLRSPTPQSSEQVTQDAMLTPTNNAGPFVFDGSAGRDGVDGGRRLTATSETLQSAAG